jgi:hypothetical protein
LREGGIVVCFGAAEIVAVTRVGEIVGKYNSEEGSL